MITAPLSDLTSMISGSQYAAMSSKNNNDSTGIDFQSFINDANKTVNVNDPESVKESYNTRKQEMDKDASNLSNNDRNSFNDNDNKVKATDTDKKTEVDKAKTDNTNESSNDNTSKKIEDNAVSKNGKVEEVKENEISEESVLKISSDILNKTAKELDISVEELEDILANLGLTAVDLVNPQNVSILVANVSGDGDMMSLLTDENLGKLVIDINTEIKDVIKEVSNELGISINDLVDKINESAKAVPLANDNATMDNPKDSLFADEFMVLDEKGSKTIADDASSLERFNSNQEFAMADNNDTSVNISEDINPVKVSENSEKIDSVKINAVNTDELKINTTKISDVKIDEAVVSKEDLAVESDLAMVTADNNQEAESNAGNEFEQSFMKNEAFTSDKSNDNDSKILESGVNTFATAINNEMQVNPEMVINESNAQFTSYVDAEDVINQINEQLKAQAGESIKELQMQLNPENLGTVHLTLLSKESGVSAQLTAQNESVRAALESQIIQLKENLEQQGVKVEAVEVTVASHAFERNLNEGNESNQNNEEYADKLRKATRKIDVNGYFEEDGDYSDEEIITASMMQADGNSMDYKV